MMNQPTNNNEEKQSEKGNYNKALTICCGILLLNLFFRPRIVLSNIKELHIVLGNIYTMLVNFCLGFCISFLFRSKFKNLTGIIGVALSCLFGIFLEINFEKSFVEKNLTVILLCSAGIVAIVCQILFSDKIRAFLKSNAKPIWKKAVSITILLVMIGTITVYILFTVAYFDYYGWNWTNIVI